MVILIRAASDEDFKSILATVNAGAERYRGVIPPDRWQDPYMPAEKLRAEMGAGVNFWVAKEEEGELLGVMGIQAVRDVVLIRHAYVLPKAQGKGIGGQLLGNLRSQTDGPILIGTWASADWAIGFYRRHGFSVVPDVVAAQLLRSYWSIPERQVETSVVFADGPVGALEALQA